MHGIEEVSKDRWILWCSSQNFLLYLRHSVDQKFAGKSLWIILVEQFAAMSSRYEIEIYHRQSILAKQLLSNA